MTGDDVDTGEMRRLAEMGEDVDLYDTVIASADEIDRLRSALGRVSEQCPNDCTRFGGKVPGHTVGSNWAWVPCPVCGGSMVVPNGETVVDDGEVRLVPEGDGFRLYVQTTEAGDEVSHLLTSEDAARLSDALAARRSMRVYEQAQPDRLTLDHFPGPLAAAVEALAVEHEQHADRIAHMDHWHGSERQAEAWHRSFARQLRGLTGGGR